MDHFTVVMSLIQIMVLYTSSGGGQLGSYCHCPVLLGSPVMVVVFSVLSVPYRPILQRSMVEILQMRGGLAITR